MGPEEHLSALGFTELEAKLYCELLRSGSATGYRLAQATGKAQANTYKALGTLVQKGAVVVDNGDPKSYRAIPSDELLAALDRDFARRKDAAQQSLADIQAAGTEDHIYQLRTVSQVFEKARSMITSARSVVLFDMWPGPLAELSSLLADAHARGAATSGIIYDDAAAGFPFRTVRSRTAEFVIRRWPGAQITLAVDAEQFLVALIDEQAGEVLHAIWSDSIYLSCHQHYALAAEIRLHALPIPEGEVPEELTLAGELPPGVRQLLRFSGDREEPAR